MNLAWLAAVLQPYDIAPHPNFPDERYDDQPAARLAGVITDRLRPRRRPEGDDRLSPDAATDLVALAARTLSGDTIAVAVPALAQQLEATPERDPAKSSALTLMACAAAAEIEDYPRMWRVLDLQLARLKESDNDTSLLRAAILQQKALRLQDTGQPHVSTLHEAVSAVDQVDPARCSTFPTSPGISWASSVTVADMRDSLRDAIASLTPTMLEDDQPGLPRWQDTVRSRQSPLMARTTRGRAQQYTKLVNEQFKAAFNSRTRTFGGPGRPDFFRELLLLELSGHGAARQARKELAQLRLIQDGEDTGQLVDAVRLLRHAGAQAELDLVLRRLNAAGPLAVLSASARQILRARLDPALLSTVELRVLHTAAQLLAPDEARTALEAVSSVLDAGGPADLPGRSQLPVLRQEVAWAAAAALGSQCDRAALVAQMLLEQARSAPADDQLHDHAIASAVQILDWTQLSEAMRETWAAAIIDRAAALPATAEAVFDKLDRPVPSGTDKSHFDSIVRRLNAILRSGVADASLCSDAVDVIRQRLAATRTAAHQGTFHMGGVNEADVAAGLILHADCDALWPDLTDFLLDAAVTREDRTSALDRLARSSVTLPAEVATAFRGAGEELLRTADVAKWDETASIAIYPPALRFLTAHDLIDRATSYEGIAGLAASPDTRTRVEAAVTLATVAGTASSADVIALALPLSNDADIQVRAHAGRALATVASGETPLATAAGRRLHALLNQDGVLAPTLVLRALHDPPSQVSPGIAQQVAAMADQHPAKSVRQAAARLLAAIGDPASPRPAQA